MLGPKGCSLIPRGQRMEQEEHLFPFAINIQLIGGPKDAMSKQRSSVGKEKNTLG